MAKNRARKTLIEPTPRVGGWAEARAALSLPETKCHDVATARDACNSHGGVTSYGTLLPCEKPDL